MVLTILFKMFDIGSMLNVSLQHLHSMSIEDLHQVYDCDRGVPSALNSDWLIVDSKQQLAPEKKIKFILALITSLALYDNEKS